MDSARERLLSEAVDLFYSRGVRAVGIDLIIARAQVAKATFYRHFPSKHRLVLAYLDRYQYAWLRWLTESIAARARTPGAQLIAIFDTIGEQFDDPAFQGSPLVNVVAELGSEFPDVVERSSFHWAELHRYITQLATAAEVRRPSRLADQWLLLIEGAYVEAHRSRRSDVAWRAQEIALVLLARYEAGGSARL